MLFFFWYNNFINFLLTYLSALPVSKLKSVIQLLLLYSLCSGELLLGLPLPWHFQLLFKSNHQLPKPQIKLFHCMRYKELSLTFWFPTSPFFFLLFFIFLCVLPSAVTVTTTLCLVGFSFWVFFNWFEIVFLWTDGKDT